MKDADLNKINELETKKQQIKREINNLLQKGTQQQLNAFYVMLKQFNEHHKIKQSFFNLV